MASLNATISQAKSNADGLCVHTVQSEYQSGTTSIKVLLPQESPGDRSFRVLYVLPVEPLDGCQFGDALAEIAGKELHSRHRLVCVMPTFSEVPWYADHPTNTRLRQESYFVELVVPFVERTYDVASDRGDRLLVGFSKSGWGAWSLLLRHPDLFEKAAAFDAPFGMASYSRYGAGGVFGSQDNFERYNVWNLLKRNADQLTGKTRFALLGHGDFRGHVQATHIQMDKLAIAHDFMDGPRRAHHWQSGWLPEAVRLVAT